MTTEQKSPHVTYDQALRALQDCGIEAHQVMLDAAAPVLAHNFESVVKHSGKTLTPEAQLIIDTYIAQIRTTQPPPNLKNIG